MLNIRFLFTLYLKSKNGAWITGAQFLVPRQNSQIIADSLRKIQHMVHQCTGRNWKPRYFLIDQSSTERKAIRDAFPGLTAGRQEVEILHCSVHTNRTLIERLGNKPEILATMYRARSAFTRIRCRELVSEAVVMAKTQSKKISEYLERHWSGEEQMKRWAYAWRNHSCMLMQTRSTNPLESYHSMLKQESKKGDQLCTLAKNLVDLNMKRVLLFYYMLFKLKW